MNGILPTPPSAVVALRMLGVRLDEVYDWYNREVGAVFAYRTFAYKLVESLIDFNVRVKTRMIIDERHHTRLEELDQTYEIFKIGYKDAKKLLDIKKIDAYAELIRPIIAKRDRLILKQRQTQRLIDAEEKSKRFNAAEDRRLAREKRKMQYALDWAGRKNG